MNLLKIYVELLKIEHSWINNRNRRKISSNIKVNFWCLGSKKETFSELIKVSSTMPHFIHIFIERNYSNEFFFIANKTNEKQRECFWHEETLMSVHIFHAATRKFIYLVIHANNAALLKQ